MNNDLVSEGNPKWLIVESFDIGSQKLSPLHLNGVLIDCMIQHGTAAQDIEKDKLSELIVYQDDISKVGLPFMIVKIDG
jgi:hypothetical protein